MKKILFSILSLGIVATVAIGATRAYFTDQEQVLGNSINTGTLDLALRDKDDQTFAPFTLGGLVPGEYTSPIKFVVRNTTLSSAPIKYRVYGKYRWANINGLYEKINVKVGTTRSNEIVENLVYWGNLSGMNFTKSPLNIGGNQVYYLQFELDTSAGNEFKGKTVTFDIVADATQTNNPGWN